MHRFMLIITLVIALSLVSCSKGDTDTKPAENANIETNTANTNSSGSSEVSAIDKSMDKTTGTAGIIKTTETTIENIETAGTFNKVEVKGFVLKYILFDTALEMFEVNVTKPGNRIERNYKDKEYYKWLLDCYTKMDDGMKTYLEEIFRSIHVWHYMNTVTKLPDSANIEDILKCISSDITLSKSQKDAANKFFPNFYTDYLKDYLEKRNNEFEKTLSNLRETVDANNPDIIGFMEKTSGISFKMKFKPEFYFIFDNVSAYGFSYGNLKISTIPASENSYDNLFGAPFHEYSHELFRTFTNDLDFQKLFIKMKNDKVLMKSWKGGANKSYDWSGWCEENLVNGFSSYLKYKYYGNADEYAHYVYDFDFYKYLKEIGFDGQKDSLRDSTAKFCKTIIANLKEK